MLIFWQLDGTVVADLAEVAVIEDRGSGIWG